MKSQVKTILCSISIALLSCYSPEKINSQFINDLNPTLNLINYHINSIDSKDSKIIFNIILNKNYQVGFNKEQKIISFLIARKYLKGLKRSAEHFSFNFYTPNGKQFFFTDFPYDITVDQKKFNWIQDFIFQHLVFSSFRELSSNELFRIDLLFEKALNVYVKDFILNCDFTGLLSSIAELFTPIKSDEKWFILSQHHIFMAYVTNGPKPIDGKKFIFMNRFTDYALAKLQGK